MRIGLRSGHSPHAKGAVGLRDEQKAMRDLYWQVERVLKNYGHTVINCNSDAWDVDIELWEGVNKANSNNVDLFISLHMNSYNGQAHGTEAWVYSCNSKAYPIAKKLVDNYSKLGFYNRGVKVNKEYYDLRNTNCPSIIFETLFCDNAEDINIWSSLSWDQLSYGIANAIDGNIPRK